MDTFEQDSAAFLEWFRCSEGTRVCSKIQIADLRGADAGRGIIATQRIDQDEELFAIPKSLVLHAQTSSLSKYLNHPLPDSDPWLPLITTILYELLRREDSAWAPYLSLLPSRFDTLMFWSDEELAQLRGSAVVNKIGKAGAEDAWRQTIIPFMLDHADLFPTSAHSREEKMTELVYLCHRAGSLIMAYAFDIDKEDTDEVADGNSDAESSLVSDDEEEDTFKGMVPFADLLNADADRNNARLFQEDGYLIMKATAHINAGDEIFNDYGSLPRSDLLRMYGYITPNYAQYDVVELAQQDIVATARNITKDISKTQNDGLNALDEIGLLEDGYTIQCLPRGIGKMVDVIPAELHMLVRALTCDLGNEASSHERKLCNGIKDDVSIEEASLLGAVCTKRLIDYFTSVEQDDELLRKLDASTSPESATANVSSHRMKMAVHVRKGEKEILHAVIKLCQEHITSRTSSMRNDANGTKRKHQGESGRATEKEKMYKKSKKDGFR